MGGVGELEEGKEEGYEDWDRGRRMMVGGWWGVGCFGGWGWGWI